MKINTKIAKINFSLCVTSLIFFSGCSVQRYEYLDFGGNAKMKIEEEKAPVKEGIWNVGAIPTKISLEESGKKILLSIDENRYLPNVAIGSDFDAGTSIELENDDDIANRCLSYKKTRNLLFITISDPQKCSGRIKIKILDAQGKIISGRSIDYVVKRKGVIALVDGI